MIDSYRKFLDKRDRFSFGFFKWFFILHIVYRIANTFIVSLAFFNEKFQLTKHTEVYVFSYIILPVLLTIATIFLLIFTFDKISQGKNKEIKSPTAEIVSYLYFLYPVYQPVIVFLTAVVIGIFTDFSYTELYSATYIAPIIGSLAFELMNFLMWPVILTTAFNYLFWEKIRGQNKAVEIEKEDRNFI